MTDAGRETRRSSLICGLPSVVCLLPATAFAQEAAHHGMPQLDFANPLTISQIVWLVIIFAALYVLLSSWALPKVGAVLDDRTARITRDLDTARASKAQADAAAADARQASRQAHEQAQTAINAAVAAAKQEAAAQAAELNAQLEVRLVASEAAIAQARRSAMASLHEIAATLATTIVERLTGHAPAPLSVQQALAAVPARRA